VAQDSEIQDRFSKTHEDAEDMQGRRKIAALDRWQESEKTRPAPGMQMMTLIPWVLTTVQSPMLLCSCCSFEHQDIQDYYVFGKVSST